MDVSGPFGATLEPRLRQACGGRLSAVQWFRTDWQRGGALTGYATIASTTLNAEGDSAPLPGVVKLPVPPRERRWLELLQPAAEADPASAVVPRLYAHGDSLDGYDLAWMVMERLPHGPLSQAWGGREFDMLLDAAGRFYQAAEHHNPPTRECTARQKDWPAVFERSRQRIQTRSVPASQRWKAALKRAGRKLDGWLELWHSRDTSHWCHGDLHLGNAMCTTAAEADDACVPGSARLIDLAEVRRGHWVEDAVYFEHLHWGERQRLAGRKVVSLLAQQRKQRHLAVGEDWPQLAEIYRGLLAASVPALWHEVPPAHAEAALTLLERLAA